MAAPRLELQRLSEIPEGSLEEPRADAKHSGFVAGPRHAVHPGALRIDPQRAPRVSLSPAESMHSMVCPVLAEDAEAAHGSLSPEQRRRLRHLSGQVRLALEASGATCVLVTAPRRGDGCTTLFQGLRKDLLETGHDEYQFFRLSDLKHLDPTDRPEETTWIVDSPAMLDSAEFLDLSAEWYEAFDGAIVSVLARTSRREDLAETASMLRASGIPPIGFVWNEVSDPSVHTQIHRGLSRIRDWFRHSK